MFWEIICKVLQQISAYKVPMCCTVLYLCNFCNFSSLSRWFQVVKADVFSADSLKTHFQGQDVIMSCLGFPASIFSAVTGYSLTMNAMISAMQEARVNRIITMTSWYTERKCRLLLFDIEKNFCSYTPKFQFQTLCLSFTL